MISERSAGGRTIALVRSDSAPLAGPGLAEAAPTFDELVLGYLDGSQPACAEALA